MNQAAWWTSSSLPASIDCLLVHAISGASCTQQTQTCTQSLTRAFTCSLADSLACLLTHSPGHSHTLASLSHACCRRKQEWRSCQWAGQRTTQAHSRSCFSLTSSLLAYSLFLTPCLQVQEGVQKLSVGRPEDNKDITPVVSSSSADFITGLVEDAKAKGATFLTPFKR